MARRISNSPHLKWNYFFLILITVANYWFWQILKENIVLLVFLLISQFLIFIIIESKHVKKITLPILILIILFSLLSGFLIKQNFDKSLTNKSPTEVYLLNQRHGYLSEGLGQIFNNKISQRYYVNIDVGLGKYLRNTSYVLDPNLYFFRSHPREKSGIDEYNKYSPFTLPLFAFGSLLIIVNSAFFLPLLGYFVLTVAVSGFVNPGHVLGPVLMFPFINIVMYEGLKILTQKIRTLQKK